MGVIIFNADDLGLSKGVNLGIVECYNNGVVNSASLMTTTNHFQETVKLINEYNLNNIGLHFNLTEGKPILQDHKTIIDQQGNFIRGICEETSIDLSEIECELEAQYQKAIDAGVLITHLDSHHHVHMNASLSRLFLRIADKFNLPLRKVANTFRHPIRKFKHYRSFRKHQFYSISFTDEFYGEDVSIETLKNIIQSTKGSIEIMCHPGYLDNENGEYNEMRVEELKLLTSKSIKKILSEL